MSKVNNSLRSFSNAINGLLIGGGALVLIGIFIVAANSGYGASLQALAVAVGLIYLGSGSIGLGIFGAFLRITASSIIEGLGGNLVTSGPLVTASATSTTTTSNDSSTSAPKAPYVSGPDSWQQLSGREYKAWQAAGQPNLKSWDEAGRPDFLSWLAQNS